MNKRLSFALVMLFAFTAPATALNYDFSAVAPSGQTLFYNINGSTVSVTRENNSTPDYNTYPTGNLVIPSSVRYNGTTYTVTTIDGYAFYGCSGLTSVTIPTSVTSIGQCAFSSCTGLTSITIPSSIATIYGRAFSHCTGLNEVNFNATNCTTMGGLDNNVFLGCTNIATLNIGENVTNFPNHAFSRCSGLTSIKSKAQNPPTAGYNCFYQIPTNITVYVPCSSIASYQAANSWSEFSNIQALPEFDAEAPSGQMLHYTVNNGGTTVTLTGHEADINGALTIPATVTYNGCNTTYTVTDIGARAFKNCHGLTSVVISSGITSIGSSAFSECNGLSSASIPNTVTSIGDSAFRGSGLTSITIPSSVTIMGDHIFETCEDLVSASIQSPITEIEAYTFSNCRKLTTVNIPNTVTRINYAAFVWCQALHTVTIPNSVTQIDDMAFGACDLLVVDIPNTVTTIIGDAFSDARHIEYYGSATGAPWGALSMNGFTEGDFVYTDETKTKLVAYIGDGGDVTIASTVDSIGDRVFSYCVSITSISIPDMVRTIGGLAFYGCNGLTNVTIPEAVISIGRSAFAYCRSLTTINYNATNCTTMGVTYSPVFEGTTALGTINIGNNVTNLPDNAFRSCTTLTALTCNAINPPTCGNNVFYNVYTNIPVYVPCGSMAAYQAANTWSNFYNYQALDAAAVGKVPITTAGQTLWYTLDPTNHTAIVVPQNDNSPYYETLPTGAVTIPATVSYCNEDYTVIAVGNSAFRNCDGMTSITIPSSVTSFSDYAFVGCSSLTQTNYIGTVAQWLGIDFYYDYSNPVYYSHNLFINGVELTTLEIPNGTTEIKKYAFCYCTSLSGSLVIPNTVTSIGRNAFSYCNGLTSITLPNNITSIADGTFLTCSGLTSIDIPNTVTSIGPNAFRHCDHLTSITVPDLVTYIGDYAFSDCSRLTTVVIGASVNDIGSGAFYPCSSLNTIYLYPATPPTFSAIITVIRYNPFFYTSGSRTLYIPCGTTEAYREAMSLGSASYIEFGCPITVTVYSSDDIYGTVSGGGIFDNGDEVTISATPNCGYRFVQWNDGNTNNPRSVTLSDDTTFTATFAASKVQVGSLWYTLDCTNGTATVVSENDEYPRYTTNPTGEITIPTTISYSDNDYTVTAIGDSAFFLCSDITAITIPNSITSIGEYAFSDCYGLLDVTIPNSVVSIGNGAFNLCTHITSISLEVGIQTIGDRAFWGCSGLSSVTIPTSVKTIGNDAFSNCGLTSVYFNADSCTDVGFYYSVFSSDPHSAFSYGNNITNFVFGENVKIIPKHICFYLSFTSVTIPNSVLSIGQGAFGRCTELTSVNIPASVTSIASNAFRECPAISSITVAEGNTVYDSRNNCNAIMETSTNKLLLGCKNTVIPDNTTIIGSYAFYGCSDLAAITIPDNVTRIDTGAFEDCYSLTTVIIPEGVTYIASGAFLASGLVSVVIPSSVTNLGSSAFYGCGQLTEIHSRAITALPIDRYTFFRVPSTTSVYVPCGSTASYNSNWIYFSNFIEEPYAVILQSDNTTMGSVEEITEPTCASHTMEFVAIPNCGYRFVQWNDGNTDNPRTVMLSEDVTFTATFEAVDKVQIGSLWYTLDCANGTATVVPQYDTYYDTKPAGDIIIPSSVTYGGTNYSVTAIGGYAFYNCSGITSASIPNSVTTIGEHAFYYCYQMISITIPNSVTIIEGGAFEHCGMNTVSLPNSIIAIGNEAFKACLELTSITIPVSVTSIGERVFSYCSNLTSMSVASGNTHYDSRDDCNAIIQTDNNTLVSGCKTTVVPSLVTAIGNYAFYACSGLTSIILPSTVTSIGASSFSRCSNLEEITSLATIPPTMPIYDVFYDVSTIIPVYVPCGTVSSYQAATGWSRFSDIQEIAGCSFTVTVTANDDTYGTVSGSGDYDNNTEVTLTATPNCGYRFVQWNDGNADNPRTVTVTDDVTYTATFDVADKVQIGGLWYTLDCANGTAAVVPENDNAPFYTTNPTGDLVIPSSITYGGSSFDVTTIGEKAFEFCSGLTSVSIPNSVNSIDNYAFSGCYSLTSITIPEGVTSIGDHTFEFCSDLTSINIPSSITSIGLGAFGHCSGITSLTIPSSVTFIGYLAFNNCIGLTSISVESGNTVYDSRENCNALIETATNTLIAGCMNTVIPEGVTSISDYAFVNCEGLASVTIPGSVTHIGEYAFDACRGITSLTIEEGVTSIDRCAFSHCIGITSLTLPGSITTIGNGAFINCSTLTSIKCLATVPPTIEFNGFYNVPTTIPVYVPCGKVTNYQAANGWSDFTNIQEVDGCSFTVTVAANDDSYGTVSGGGDYDNNIEATLTATPNCGYRFVQWNDGNTDNPRTVTVTEDVTYTATFDVANKVQIGGLWYTLDCANGTATVVPENDNDPYYNTFPTGDLVIPSSITYGSTTYTVTAIGAEAFEHCGGLTSVIIPNTVTTIGEAAFSHCTGLTSLTIPSSVTSIGFVAFRVCSGLTSIVVEAGNPVYDSRNNCNAIIETAIDTLIKGCKTTVIPNTVTVIGYGSFTYCTGMTSFTIPNSVTTIGGYAFYGSDLTSITIPNSVTTIGEFAFWSSSLTSVDIPNSVTTIGGWAFGACANMISVTIPSSVTSLGEGAFDNCSGLTSLICLAENPPTVGLYVFNNIPTNIPVYVPCGKVADYQATNGWSGFTNIQEVGGCIPAGPTNIAVYADGNAIVVEGATGNTVTLYDNNGNTLATSTAPAGTPLRFESLASGTYFVKIGILPARMKVVVQ